MGNWITALGLPEVIEGLLCCTSSTLSALCSSCTTGYPRFIFSLFLLFGTISSFLVLTPNMRSTLDKLPYFCTAVTTEEMCDNMVGYGAVYRICFSLAMFYGLFALLMLNTNSAKDIRVKFHNGYWLVKLVLLVAILVGAFHIPRYTEFGRLLMYVGLTAGFVFIMIQILLVIDFAHSWSFSWAERMESGNSNFWGFALVSSTILVYSMAITMAVFYYLYFTDLQNLSKCRGNMFLISFNAFHCLLASVISILPRVQETAAGSGLLQSSIVTLYTMYLTWCTLSSEPDVLCNPMGDVILEYDKVSGVNGQAIFDCVLMFALLIFACNVRSSTSKLEKIGFSLSKYATKVDYYDDGEKSTLNYRDKNDPEKYVGDENIDEYVEYNYSFFHFVMFLASLQLMMVVTNWHSPDELSDLKKLVKNWATVWIQLSSSFICVLFYIWATVTPLLVRTWGSCLGFDYESIPTEDDYDRARRRRELAREHREMYGLYKYSKIETDITNEGSLSKNNEVEGQTSQGQLGNLSGGLHKDNTVEHEFTTSTQMSQQKLGNLSLVNQSEQITQDSGMCDVTNFTSRSRSISRASGRPNSSKSTTVDTRLSPTSEHRSKSVLTNQSMYSEKIEVDREIELNIDKPDIENLGHDGLDGSHNNVCTANETNRKNNSHKRSTDLENTSNSKSSEIAENGVMNTPGNEKRFYRQAELENHHFNSKSPTLNAKQDLQLTLPRPQSAQLNKYSASGKRQKANIRPHSSMAFVNSTFLEENRALTHSPSIDNDALPTRSKTCEPSLRLQKKGFLRRKKRENETSFSFEEDCSTENGHSSSIVEQETGDIPPRTRKKQGELSKIAEDNRPISELTHSRERLRERLTQNENSEDVKNAFLQDEVDLQLSLNVKETENDHTTFSERDANKNEDLSVVERNDDTGAERIVKTPLQMQDHLKWVKSLRRTREKLLVPLRRKYVSEMNASVENRTNDSQDAAGNVANNRTLNMSNDNKAIKDNGKSSLDKSQVSIGKNKDGSGQTLTKASESFDASHSCNKKNMNTSNTNKGTHQRLTKEERTREMTSNELTHDQTRCRSELQTPNASREILRLQEKILKFQAKVVKTQQRIFEMQQDGDL